MIGEIGGGLFSKRIVEELNKCGIKSILITPSLKDFKFKNKLKDLPVIHFTGSPTVSLVGILSLYRFKNWKKKIVVSWIGFDIRKVKNNWFWRLTSKILVKKIDVHITDDEFVAKELNDLGIPAKPQSLPVYKIYPITSLPSSNQITVYLPDETSDDFELYQGTMIKKLVKEFENINFLITRNSGKFFKNEKNVKCVLWVNDMQKVYESSLAIIRLPKHDATGATIIETLSMGRIMIASGTNFPHCEIINNYNELKQCVEKIIKNPKLNEDGSNYVHENYDNSKLANELIKICNNLI